MEDNSNRRSSRRVTQPSTSALSGKSKRRFDDIFPPGTKAIVKQNSGATAILIDFLKFEMASLQTYSKHFELSSPPTSTKCELASCAAQHFGHHPHVRDSEVISRFLFANDKHRRHVKEKIQQHQQK